MFDKCKHDYSKAECLYCKIEKLNRELKTLQKAGRDVINIWNKSSGTIGSGTKEWLTALYNLNKIIKRNSK